MADAEARDKSNLLGKFRTLEAELEGLKDRIDAEHNAKAELQKVV